MIQWGSPPLEHHCFLFLLVFSFKGKTHDQHVHVPEELPLAVYLLNSILAVRLASCFVESNTENSCTSADRMLLTGNQLLSLPTTLLCFWISIMCKLWRIQHILLCERNVALIIRPLIQCWDAEKIEVLGNFGMVSSCFFTWHLA